MPKKRKNKTSKRWQVKLSRKIKKIFHKAKKGRFVKSAKIRQKKSLRRTKARQVPKDKAQKGKKVKRAEPAELVADPTEEQMWRLVEKGRGRGFITEVEAFQIFPRLENYLPLCEVFLDALERNNVSLVEVKEGLLGVKKEQRGVLEGLKGPHPHI